MKCNCHASNVVDDHSLKAQYTYLTNVSGKVIEVLILQLHQTIIFHDHVILG